ncbi:conserved hypothetical protein [Neospora caninum Liverpool]|uniref:Phosphorylated adapter RNA export protein n=1 Tax=Neospora caninum (strain Liverpool) TaxID=572307 RepID=F0VCX0_NEOCL|nr:conserved hypothetical protein [Neospora caninum Liverpool]CBZ51485.1 conserved hypothetical protein [Neospora caninum Liverpool]CEL65435.1 TPA: Phosphorylated adapter RNA export protein [Neospora caninum Liverpool]|eukprot:XP_003881518.1 conserved hypothetical protein [Neospora caninum Liverpool]
MMTPVPFSPRACGAASAPASSVASGWWSQLEELQGLEGRAAPRKPRQIPHNATSHSSSACSASVSSDSQRAASSSCAFRPPGLRAKLSRGDNSGLKKRAREEKEREAREGRGGGVPTAAALRARQPPVAKEVQEEHGEDASSYFASLSSRASSQAASNLVSSDSQSPFVRRVVLRERSEGDSASLSLPLPESAAFAPGVSSSVSAAGVSKARRGAFSSERRRRAPNSGDFSPAARKRRRGETVKGQALAVSGEEREEELRKDVLDTVKILTSPEEIDALVCILAKLGERNFALFERVIHRRGREECMEILEETLAVESAGGQSLPCGRRKSPGGVFLRLLQNRISAEDKKFIWDEQQRAQRERKKLLKSAKRRLDRECMDAPGVREVRNEDEQRHRETRDYRDAGLDEEEEGECKE